MNSNNSDEALRILVDTYHDEIMQAANDPYGIRYVIGETTLENNWDSLLEEPVLQIIYYDADDEMDDIEQFIIGDNIAGFCRDGNTNKEFHTLYNIPEEEIKKVFDALVKDFLTGVTELATLKQIKNISEINSFILDRMFEFDYFDKNYSPDQLLEIYEELNDSRLLTGELKDVAQMFFKI